MLMNEKRLTPNWTAHHGKNSWWWYCSYFRGAPAKDDAAIFQAIGFFFPYPFLLSARSFFIRFGNKNQVFICKSAALCVVCLHSSRSLPVVYGLRRKSVIQSLLKTSVAVVLKQNYLHF